MTERMSVLKKMLEQTEAWDGTAEAAPAIIAACKPLVHELSTLSEQPYSPLEKKIMATIAAEQGEMIAAIRVEKTAIATELRTLNKKESVVQHYLYPKRKPTFVNQQL